MNVSELTRFLDSLPERGIPGVDMTVHIGGREVFRHAAGYADRESKRPVAPGTLYNLYSVSKVITCAAALQLFEKGLFLLTDPLDDYLPEFGHMMVRCKKGDGTEDICPATRKITIQDLFTMSAGLTYNLGSTAIRDAIAATDGRGPTREIVRAIAKDPLAFEPGSHWNYSLCHDVLGGLIEVVSGQAFGAYLRGHVFAPAAMADTGFRLPEGKQSRLAAQYRFNDATRTAARIPPSNPYAVASEYESGGAGLISSLEDYIKFADALANDGVAATGERILSRAAIDLMRGNCLDAARLTDFNWPQMAGYGYGLGVRTMMDRARGGSLGPVGEFGWGGAAGAYVLIDPQNRIAVYYAQHMLNNQEPYVHPRLRNLVYAGLKD